LVSEDIILYPGSIASKISSRVNKSLRMFQ